MYSLNIDKHTMNDIVKRKSGAYTTNRGTNGINLKRSFNGTVSQKYHRN